MKLTNSVFTYHEESGNRTYMDLWFSSNYKLDVDVKEKKCFSFFEMSSTVKSLACTSLRTAKLPNTVNSRNSETHNSVNHHIREIHFRVFLSLYKNSHTSAKPRNSAGKGMPLNFMLIREFTVRNRTLLKTRQKVLRSNCAPMLSML